MCSAYKLRLAHPNIHSIYYAAVTFGPSSREAKDGHGRVGIEAVEMGSTLVPEGELQGPAFHTLQPVGQCLIFVIIMSE